MSHRNVLLFTRFSKSRHPCELRFACYCVRRCSRSGISIGNCANIPLHCSGTGECFEPMSVSDASHEQVRRRSANGMCPPANVVEGGSFLSLCLYAARQVTGQDATEFAIFDEGAFRHSRSGCWRHQRQVASHRSRGSRKNPVRQEYVCAPDDECRPEENQRVERSSGIHWPPRPRTARADST